VTAVLEQVAGAVLAILLACAGCVAYFWGSNRLVTALLEPRGSGPTSQSTKAAEQIRPWLFLIPALLFLSLFLVYPAFDTLVLSLFDRSGSFVGLRNYVWAVTDPSFQQATLNNVLWLVLVPAFATALGLLIAVLADQVWWGSIAKSLVFMPMAISFVGASVIWKFVYDFRAASSAQVGLLNAAVTSFGLPPQAWLTLPVWNSILLMVILIWIQTGFAVVVLAAALRGVPQDTLEAARIDGANPVQIVFRIILPQMRGTLAVVWTTITIITLKVFDTIFAMTNGQWNTEVLANLMFKWMFVNLDYGRASTIAIVIMLAVLPVLIWQVRHAYRQELAL
jgi:alpha-glucoside transport system permease protein